MSTKNAQLETTSKENNEVGTKFDQLLENSKKLILDRTIKNPDDLKKLLDSYSAIKIVNVDSKAESNHVETGLKECRKIRLAIDNNRKDLTAPATKYQKSLIDYVEPWLKEIEKTENHLKNEKQKYDDMVAAEKNRLFTERASILAESGYQLQSGFYVSGPIQVKADTITELNQQEIDYYVSLGKQELERKSKELEREERLNQKEIELNKKLALIDQKTEELNQKIAELEAQKEALDKTYESVDKVENTFDEVVVAVIGGVLKTEQPVIEKNTTSAIDIFAETGPSTMDQEETPVDIFAGQDSIIPEEISEYQKGFNDCRMKILDILNNSESFGKKLATLKEIVRTLEA